MPSVISRAKRTLRPLNHFRFFDDQGSSIPSGLPLLENETPIGIYLNDLQSFKEAVTITSRALILESEGTWKPISYASIAKAVTPTTKRDVQDLTLLLHDGSTVSIPIRGKARQTSDVFEFLRFLDRVLADQGQLDQN